MNERKIAAKILYNIEHDGAYTNIAINKAFDSDIAVSPEGRGFISEIVHGVIERRITLEYIISKFSSVKINKIAPQILIALQMGIYQLFYMDKVPDSAAVNESVKLAKASGGQRSGGFVNAVLRNILRNKDNIKYPDKPVEYLSVFYSFPEELVNYFVDEFGFDFTDKLFEAYYARRPITLRCNSLKTDAENLVKTLEAQGVEAEVYKNELFPELSCAVCVDRIKNIEKLSPYRNGEFYVQDIAAMMVAEVLEPKSGDVVIDMCAAPGGKTTHIAEKMNNIGTVYAFDVYEHKIKLIKENAARLGIDIIKACVQDASVLNSEYIEKADCVLVDAPCSGFGIIGKKPDIKYQRQISDVEELAELSFKIISTAAEYVKHGGTLVFSTCTIDKKENEMVVEKFISKFGDKFVLQPIKSVAKENTGYVTLYPHIDNTDGFFICKFKKL